MNNPSSQTTYRIDSFTVPPEARARFLEIVGETHTVLREQPGFQRDLIVENVDASNSIDFVTLVEWDAQEAFDAAVAAVRRRHQELGVDPRRFIEESGITAFLGVYHEVQLSPVD